MKNQVNGGEIKVLAELRWKWFSSYRSKANLRITQVLGSAILFGGGAWAQKPVAELPRVHVDTNWSEPTGGKTWTVHSVADFTNSLEKSSPGDVIVLDAGRVYTGNFLIPAKSNPDKKWIYVTSSGYGKLPAPGTRVSPSDSVNMPKIVTPNVSPAIRWKDGASYWRFVGVEIYSASTYAPKGYTPGVYYGYSLVDNFCYPNLPNCPSKPNLPSNITFDRVYVHGDATHDVQAGICGNQIGFAVIDSYVSDIHLRGQDAQAVNGYITPGPIKLVNNYLEAAGENVIFGGSGRGAGGYVPSDIEVRNNYFFKPLSWVPLSLNGRMVVKNSFELKSAQRILFDNNIIENKWDAAQVTGAFLLTVRTCQSGDVAVVKDVTITNNVLKNVISGFSLQAVDDQCGTPSYPDCHNAGSTERVYIANNLVTLWDITAQGGSTSSHTGLIVFSPGIDRPNGGVPGIPHDVVVQHNTVVPYGNQTCWASVYFSVMGTWKPPFPQSATNNMWIIDNVLCRQPQGQWGLQGMPGLTQYMGVPSTPPFDMAQRFRGNVMYVLPGDKVQSFPPHNLSTSKAFRHVDPANGNFQLLEPRWTETMDGKPAGIDFTKLPK
jgi:hypothetical protein